MQHTPPLILRSDRAAKRSKARLEGLRPIDAGLRPLPTYRRSQPIIALAPATSNATSAHEANARATSIENLVPSGKSPL